jgi:hypothetical protein
MMMDEEQREVIALEMALKTEITKELERLCFLKIFFDHPKLTGHPTQNGQIKNSFAAQSESSQAITSRQLCILLYILPEYLLCCEHVFV